MSAIRVSKLNTFKGHKDAIYTLEAAGGISSFFSGGGDGMVVLWDLQKPDQGQLIANLPNSVYALQYIPGLDQLVIGQNYQGIHLIDLSRKKELRARPLSRAAIFDIQYVEERLFIATGEGTVYVTDLKDLTLLTTLSYAKKSARCIAINPQNDEFAVGYSDHTVRVFSRTDYRLLYELEGHKSSVFTAVYHPKRQLLITAGRDARINIWDAANSYKLIDTIVAHMYAINHIEFSPSGQHFVTCSMDKSIKIWDASRFQLLKVIDKARHASHGTSVNKLYWSEFRHQLVSCSDDRTISVWNLNI